MKRFGGTGESAMSKKPRTKSIVIYSAVLLVLILIFAVLQTSNIRFFGQIPDVLLALICAVGFILGGEFGALLGLFASIFIELLGGAGFTLTPILYVLCGYLCGALKNKLLSSNFVSFLVFGAMAGIVREIFTLIYFGLSSEQFSLGQLIKDVIIGEYFAYFVCIVPMYFTVFAIYLLFKGKDEGSRLVK